MEAFEPILRYAPLVAFAYVLLAPLETIQEIRNRKNVGSFSSFPFLSLFANCFLWSVYGYVADAFTCLWANVLGTLAGTIFTCIYAQYGKIPTEHLSFAGSIVVIVLAVYFTFDGQPTMLFFLGLLGDLACVILLSSPLATIRTVVLEKDSTSMPFKVSWSMFQNGVAWFLYGLLIEKDAFIWIPNAIGTCMSMIQLYVINLYPPKNGSASKEARKAEIEILNMDQITDSGE